MNCWRKVIAFKFSSAAIIMSPWVARGAFFAACSAAYVLSSQLVAWTVSAVADRLVSGHGPKMRFGFLLGLNEGDLLG